MSAFSTLRRRSLLTMLASLGTVLGLPVRAAGIVANDPLPERLAALFPHARASARALGIACRRAGACAGTPQVLAEQVCADPAERHRLTRCSVEELQAWIDARIRADFTEGRIVRVEGWMLSETEARLYALVAAG